jgi:hypothetical protein
MNQPDARWANAGHHSQHSIRINDQWRVCWMPADLKWHGYDPTPEVASINEFLAVVDKDENACFFG